jgi:hypothetical protein
MINSNSSRTGRDSFAEQRELTQPVAQTEEISELMGRPSTTIRRLALRLGIRLKQSGAR